jgi:hypothetical protein
VQQPDRRPRALTARDTCADFDATVSEIELAFAVESPGRIRSIRFPATFNSEKAVRDGNIVRAVTLQLVVTPATKVGATVALVDVPLRGIERIAVEVVFEYQLEFDNRFHKFAFRDTRFNAATGLQDEGQNQARKNHFQG